MKSPLDEATAALRQGKIVLLYDADGREEETDMVALSEHVTAATLRTMRTEAGGLVCTTLAPEHHRALGLPFLSDIIQDAAARHPTLARLLPDDIRYDAAKPAFGLTVNHRSTFTGITDNDRATTITALARFVTDLDRQAAREAGRPRQMHGRHHGTAADPQADAAAAFGRAFRAPGHVSLLNGAPGGLADRQGHTELSIDLARQAGAVASTTLCEMLGSDGEALPRKDAQAYAARHGLVFLTGREVLDAWQARNARTTAPAVRAR